MRLILFFLLLSLGADAQIIRANPFYVPTAAAAQFLLDAYPNAAAAYSLRKLKASYSGSAIRVRRKSDNTEQDIGFVGEDLDTTSLKNFVGTSSTDTGFVVTWYDQASTRNATQSTGVNQPRIITSGVLSREGTKITMLFDGTNDFFRVDSIVNSGAIYFFTTIKPNTTLSQRSIYAQISNSVIGQIYIFVGRTTARLGITWLNAYLTSSNTNFNTSLQLFNHYKTGNTSNWNYGYYRNGLDEGAFTSTSNPISTARSTAIGRDGTANTGYLSAELSEIIYYTSDQSSNRTGIETNINNYYGLW